MSEWNFKREPEHLTHSVYLPPSALPAPPIEEVRAPGIVRGYSSRALSKDNPTSASALAAQQRKQQAAANRVAQERTPYGPASTAQPSQKKSSGLRNVAEQFRAEYERERAALNAKAQAASQGTATRATATRGPSAPASGAQASGAPSRTHNGARPQGASGQTTSQYGPQNTTLESVYTKTPAARTDNAKNNKKGNPGCAILVFLIILLINVAPRIFEGIKDLITDDSTPGFSSSAPAFPDSDDSESESGVDDPRLDDYYGVFAPVEFDSVGSFSVVPDPETGYFVPEEYSMFPPDLKFVFLEDEYVIEDVDYGLQFDRFGAVNLDNPNIIWDSEAWVYVHEPSGYEFSMMGLWQDF